MMLMPIIAATAIARAATATPVRLERAGDAAERQPHRWRGHTAASAPGAGRRRRAAAGAAAATLSMANTSAANPASTLRCVDSTRTRQASASSTLTPSSAKAMRRARPSSTEARRVSCGVLWTASSAGAAAASSATASAAPMASSGSPAGSVTLLTATT